MANSSTVRWRSVWFSWGAAWAGLGCLLFLGGCVSHSLPREKAEARYQAALALEQDGASDKKVEKALLQAMAADPVYAPPHNALGQFWTKRQLRSREEIVAEYETAIRLDPNLVAAHANLAAALAGHDDAAADRAVSRAIELAPDDGWLWELRASIRQNRGLSGESLADYTRAIELQPERVQSWLGRSQVKRDRKDLAGAIADVTQAIELQPEEAAFHFMRGKQLEEKGDLVAALADYDWCVQKDPPNPAYHMAAGSVRYLLGDFEGALADFKYMETAPASHAAYGGFWSHLLRLRLSQPAEPADLKLGLDEGADPWTRTVAKFLNGELDEFTLLDAATTGDKAAVKRQRGEAFYYAGMMRLVNHDPAGARKRFTSCVETGARELVEYKFAQAELGRRH